MTSNEQWGELMQQVGEMRADIKSLVGNGSPGRVSKLEDAVNSLQDSRKWVLGYVACFSFLVTLFLALHDHLFAALSSAPK